MNTIQELIPLIEQWGMDKGLIHEDNRENQYLKFLEETGETAKYLLLRNASDEKLASKGLTREMVEHEIQDGFGDMAVTIIILAKQNGVELELSCYADFSDSKINNITDSVAYEYVYPYVLIELQSVCTNYGYSLETCLNMAWNTIKDRKGQTVNGTFIKD